MANTLYDKGRGLFLTAGLDWSANTIKCILVDTAGYTPNFTTDQWLSDIGSTYRIGGSSGQTLGSKTTTGGAADAADITFSAVTGASVEALVIYMSTGVEGSSPLIAYIDTATGLPITPNGGDIIVTWDNGPNKIFKL